MRPAHIPVKYFKRQAPRGKREVKLMITERASQLAHSAERARFVYQSVNTVIPIWCVNFFVVSFLALMHFRESD